MKDYTRVSRFISLVLRHDPSVIGLEMDPNGAWVEVDGLLRGLNAKKPQLTLCELKELVELDEKQRYRFSDDGKRIRASQGHSASLPVRIIFPTADPGDELFHGTTGKKLDYIFESGLLPMDRQYVHLSADVETAIKVGSRRGKPVVLRVDCAAMKRDGYEFFISDNGVWLMKEVPAKYLSVVG